MREIGGRHDCIIIQSTSQVSRSLFTAALLGGLTFMRWMLMSKVADLPPPQGPFPEPSKTQIGDFYVRLGMTIAAWQFVEASLSLV